jgi:diguanylate cyclase (GGDEF)-like protein
VTAEAHSGKKEKNRVRILLGESEPGEVRMYLREILAAEPAFEFSSAGTLAEMLAVLKESPQDVLLLDLGLPGGAGLEGLRQVRKLAPNTPAILLAGTTERDIAQQALEQGAVDFLLKGHIDHRTVLRAVHCSLWRQRETTSSLHPHGLDELTGLFNRHGFERMAAQHFQQAQKHGGTLVLLRADVDNLAAIHRAGGATDSDRALQATAQLLEKSFRRTDLLGRIGEGAFAALLVDAVEPSAPVLRQRLERRLEALNDSQPQPCRISLSIGVRFGHPAGGDIYRELLEGAEADLQRIKAEKRRLRQLPANGELEPAGAKNSELGKGRDR